jgi:hypothetical protein
LHFTEQESAPVHDQPSQVCPAFAPPPHVHVPLTQLIEDEHDWPNTSSSPPFDRVGSDGALPHAMATTEQSTAPVERTRVRMARPPPPTHFRMHATPFTAETPKIGVTNLVPAL